MSDEGEYPECCRTVNRKARKAHKCCECGNLPLAENIESELSKLNNR